MLVNNKMYVVFLSVEHEQFYIDVLCDFTPPAIIKHYPQKLDQFDMDMCVLPDLELITSR